MKNIILTGLMGSGKSSVALALSQIFKELKLVETDLLIEQKEKKSINQIFEQNGEKYFRGLEKKLIENLLDNENQIISLGGGSLENDFDFEKAKKTSIIFYLKANVEILYERIKNNKDRPLLNCENPKEKLNLLLKKREANYMKADYVIDVNTLSVNEATSKIVRICNETGNY